MTVLRVAAFSLLGSVFGSFLTVLIERVPRKEPIGRTRSRCPACHATIRARDNVPVLSYVALRGRCRACTAPISPRYPLLEAATAGLFAAAALAFRDVFTGALAAVFLGLLLALGVIDVEHRIVPNAVVYPAMAMFAVAVLAGRLAGRHLDLPGGVIGFVAFGAALLLVALASPGGMGMGDVKFAALIGLVLGSLGLRYVGVAAALAILGGGMGALVALLRGRSRKSALAFGPYLAAGAGVALLWANPIAHAYLSGR